VDGVGLASESRNAKTRGGGTPQARSQSGHNGLVKARKTPATGKLEVELLFGATNYKASVPVQGFTPPKTANSSHLK
jgi:hypothetical protein